MAGNLKPYVVVLKDGFTIAQTVYRTTWKSGRDEYSTFGLQAKLFLTNRNSRHRRKASGRIRHKL